ncbi:5-oxoprolinase [Saccharolobus solfataricus]|uniref:N-methylhydantoinase B (HyuB-3) n=3 Tax=Saccharolobus solfataricus TaxID=2287 RepID=Q97UR7_SACS2|nr:hydantoinase B/oxoprolinase family protein [Saccharolobus solfataricus]AAK43039.1 N-methylhydantoinase B (hyuB-3) [Saccharolobus solfataricus P2]AKA73101.1 5-oxoprolinase [Saccharolobus solfataricus]AKA75799.1 5-oxoprolinase [Saccharolobus solfataricus]AKA78491.1 5-oxoprolinase [Saccharolobus solfataricus]AZF67599.1 5-oxoprolinase [Saccharolobus solfataricus]
MTSWEIIYKASEFIAEEMGVMLKRSAMSPNIRERMDHSCAITDAEGNIIAQAEHIPVHLGSFSIGVKNTLNQIEELEEGDMIVLNDPYTSGTHLNDVMVLAPVYYNGNLMGYVVNKAHQVDVGGPMPGSLNPYATTIYEEGFVIPPVRLMRKGEINNEIINIIKHNFKVPEVSIGDLNAQISANLNGIARIKQMFDKYGYDNVLNAWKTSMEYGKKLALSEISKWGNGIGEDEDYLEIGDELKKIRLKVKVDENGVYANFAGTDTQMEGPLNAVYGVTFSAVSFVIRSLIGKDIPTNEGFYSLIKVDAPKGTIVNPNKPAAVGGGNVETSQRIADVTFKALSHLISVPAAGSGTMMNVMMGGMYKGKYWAYYETIGGGTGARPNKDGVSAVQVNMTNTLNTPIEIAERYYPIMFTIYRIRENSGGVGKYKGGDGIIRAFRVLEKTRLSIIAERFRVAPWGLKGGGNGKPAKVTIIRADGRKEEMPSKFSTILNKGDEIIIETPGGGGYYTPNE